MRIIGAWGSDGYSEGDNGFGPCGSYQYGSFDDFTLDVTTTTSVPDLAADHAGSIIASPNPTTGLVTLMLNNAVGARAEIILESMDGRVVGKWHGTEASTLRIDISDLPPGIYLLRNNTAIDARPLRIVKQ
jgi:hypothetical protein